MQQDNQPKRNDICHDNVIDAAGLKPGCHGIAAIEASLFEFQEEFDHICTELSTLLPSINRIVQQAYERARHTIHALEPGTMIMANEVSLQKVLDFVEHRQQEDRELLGRVRSLSRQSQGRCPSRVDALWVQVDGRLLDTFDNLEGALVRSCQLASELIGHLHDFLSFQIPSLHGQLQTVATICSTLIDRAAATREPIARIMTGLQVHDIVSQDLHTIFDGFRVIDEITSLPCGSDDLSDAFASANEIYELCERLLHTLLDSTMQEQINVEQEMMTFRNILDSITANKDELTRFIHLDDGKPANFINDITKEYGTLKGIAEFLVELATAASQVGQLCGGLLAGLNDTSPSQACKLDRRSQASDASGLCEILAQRQHNASDYTRRLKTMHRELAQLREETDSYLHGLHQMLCAAAQSFELYSRRSMQLTDRFMRDLQGLNAALKSCELIRKDMQSQADILHNGGGGALTRLAQPGNAGCNPAIVALLDRLAHPHVSALADKTSQPEDGLTLF